MDINNNYDRAKSFKDWTNNPKNAEEPTKAEDFTMFDMDLSTYSKDVKEFAQEYLDLFDSNKDNNISRDEFMDLCSDGQEIPEELKSQAISLFNQCFNDLNMNKDDNINAEEYASMLMVVDTDFDKYVENDYNMAEALDGKLNYSVYAGQGDPTNINYDAYLFYQDAFYNQFYNK